MIKMLQFDLDDTLLNSEKIVTSRTKRALWKLHESGIKIAYNTARTRWSAEGLFDGIPLDGVSYCSGASIFCDERLVFESSINGTLGKHILDDFIERFPKRRYFSVFEPYSHVTGEKLWKNGQSCDENENDVIGRYGYQRIVLLETSHDDIYRHMVNGLKYEETRYGGVSVTPMDVSKGHAARRLAEYFGIDMDDVAAFGDDRSDMPMIRFCGTGIAMKNAVYETKSAADYITDSHDNEGVVKWIEKHIFGDDQ